VTDLVSMSLELLGGRVRLLSDVVAHVGMIVGEEVRLCRRG
jgi:hypothetical protein